jgi:putative FmdB family regulatory protein
VPTYDYRCKNGHTFEVFQKMTDDPVTECETCGAPVERVFHPIAVHFKGSGFYTTDYAKKKAPAGTGASSGDSGDSSGGDSGGGEKSSDSGKSESTSTTGSGDAAKSSSSD